MRMSDAEVAGSVFGVFIILFTFLFVLLICAGLYVLKSIIYRKIFEKAGKEKNLAWIPFYREYILVEVADINWYWILIMYAPVILSILTSWVPFIGIFTTSICAIFAKVGRVNVFYNFNKKFKCEDVFLLLYILLPELIPLGMMGFGKYEYDASVKVAPDGFLGDLGFIKKEEKQEAPKKEEPKKEEQPEVIKEEEVKVSKEEIKETKEEVVKDADEVKDSKPKKKNNNKKTTKKKDE